MATTPTEDEVRFAADFMRSQAEEFLEQATADEEEDIKQARCEITIAEFFLKHHKPAVVEVPNRPECTFMYCPNKGGCPEKCQYPLKQ